MSEKRVQLLVPDWIKGAKVRGPFGEGEVIRIPEEEFADPDFVIPAEDFPGEWGCECGNPDFDHRCDGEKR